MRWEMHFKKLFCILLLALLSLQAFGDTLSETQTYKLRALLMRYEANEMQLSDELQVLNQNLTQLYQESETLKKQTSDLETSLTISQSQVETLTQDFIAIGKSIETLETSLQNMERQKTILKYGFIGSAAVAIVTTALLLLR